MSGPLSAAVSVRLAEVMRAGAASWLRTRVVASCVYKAVDAILACRTASLGGHAGLCDAGHISYWYNACRHRCCPRCAFFRVQRWLQRQSRILLGCAHHHVVFTVPHELNALWRLNYATLGRLLFASTRDALSQTAEDPRYLGARPGILMALHTWGQTLALHPHVHCVVTAGGVDLGGQWRHCRRRHFLPAELLKRRFRANVLRGLDRLARRDALRLPEGWSLAEVDRLARRLEHKRWNVRVHDRYADPTAVLSYLGAYLHGGPMGEGRLVALAHGAVSFHYKDYRLGIRKVMSLPLTEFVRRYLQHVPPEGFHMIRGYGLYRRGSQNNHLRDHAAQALPLPSALRSTLAPDRNPSWCPTPGQTLCATCGLPIRVVSKLKPAHAWPRPRSLPVAA